MEKPAENRYPIHDLLRRRWSPRAFAPRPVEPDVLRSLFEAARWAASSYNEQPWAFLVATPEEPAEFERLLGCLVPGNQAWARQAPVLLLTVARLRFARNDKPNRHAFHDVGLAVASLTVEATARGLVVHQMAGIEPEKARAVYALPEGTEAVTGVALGYSGEPESLPEKLRAAERAPRSRRSLEEFVFTGAWGRAAPLLQS